MSAAAFRAAVLAAPEVNVARGDAVDAWRWWWWWWCSFVRHRITS